MEKYNCKEQKMLEFPYVRSGEKIRFPVGVVYGAKDGPTLAVVGGMHGSEFCGIQAAIDTFNKLDPAKLCGKVIITMIYNMPAFLGHMGFVIPNSDQNAMSTFPGKLDGTLAEAMSYYLMNNVLNEKIDFMIELHGGDIPEALVPFALVMDTGDAKLDKMMNEMAECYNISCLIHSEGSTRVNDKPGSLFGKLLGKGIPAILTEAGMQGILDLDKAKIHEDGIFNVMKKMGMLEGPLVNTEKRIPMKYSGGIRNQTPGMFYPCVWLHDIVKKGQKLGEIRDYFGQYLCDITAPVDGMVTVVRTSSSAPLNATLIEMHEIL